MKKTWCTKCCGSGGHMSFRDPAKTIPCSSCNGTGEVDDKPDPKNEALHELLRAVAGVLALKLVSTPESPVYSAMSQLRAAYAKAKEVL